jgi:hypothetical protein
MLSLAGSYMLVSLAAFSQSFEASDKPKGATPSIENKSTERGEITSAGSSLPENSKRANFQIIIWRRAIRDLVQN